MHTAYESLFTDWDKENRQSHEYVAGGFFCCTKELNAPYISSKRLTKLTIFDIV